MTLTQILKELGLDQYDRDARIGPSLFAILPASLLAAIWTPGFTRTAASVAVLVLTCGVAYLLKGAARTAGENVEQRLLARLGGWPTTLALRHNGPLLDPVTRSDYHHTLRRLGRTIPSAEEQDQDLESADAHFGRSVKWLLEQTRRPDHPTDNLLLRENIEYGFRRNLVGLKTVALTVLFGCMIVDASALFLSVSPQTSTIVAGLALLSLYLADLLLWVRFLNDEFVEKASWKYAKRLLATLDTL